MQTEDDERAERPVRTYTFGWCAGTVCRAECVLIDSLKKDRCNKQHPCMRHAAMVIKRNEPAGSRLPERARETETETVGEFWNDATCGHDISTGRVKTPHGRG